MSNSSDTLSDPKDYTASDSDTHIAKVQELDPELRPQEKALKYGTEHLSTSELLALILRTGQPDLPITEITRRLMAANSDSLHILGRKSIKELMTTKGLGTVKALQVKAIMQLAIRYFNEDYTQAYRIRGSKDLADYMRPVLGSKSQEEIWIITLSRSNHIINRHMITRGSAVASVFDLKGCLKRALIDEAQGVILCHNHPSGNLAPSPQDDNITHLLMEGARSVDIRLLDHIIIAHTGHYSYADEGRLR